VSVVLRQAVAEASRQKTLASFDRVESELQPSGYLVGDRFSVADLEEMYRRHRGTSAEVGARG
jgi:glutathione S-transferase